MNICKITIENFRGIKSASFTLEGNHVFVGDNNSGKSTIFEAIDLVMGPERLARRPVIDEHDFYAGEYLIDGVSTEIHIEVIVINLNEEQIRHFGNNIEWWNGKNNALIEGPPAESTDQEGVIPALRLAFKGRYDPEEDDFTGQTYFASSLREGAQPESFRTRDKRLCGFLYLRTLRTGSRSLSLESGSLLDVILQLKELKPQMWESVLTQLKNVAVAAEPALGITEILSDVQQSLSSLVPYESADKPQIRVSSLTREHLRKVLTVFMASGSLQTSGMEYATPYYHQGTGTINTLVLSLLSMIADIKENVIFAMEEPEIALPPHIQKRVVLSVIEKSTQALFTSHSPYVLEEFDANQILVVSRINGMMDIVPAGMPPAVKPKAYQDELRRRFCESLLSRRVLIAEGRTELDVYSCAARKLQRLHPSLSLSFELLGISLVTANTDTQVEPLGNYYRSLNKTVYAVFDKQDPTISEKIKAAVDYTYEAQEHGLENVCLNGIDHSVLLRYGLSIVADGSWPSHLTEYTPKEDMTAEQLKHSLLKYFKKEKGNGALADLISFCSEDEMPEFIKNTIYSISETIYPPVENQDTSVEGMPNDSSEE